MASSQFTNDERFDGLYLNVAQTTRGIDPLLDTVFSFLRRKTDFFKGPPGTSAGEGSAAAVAKVNEVLRKHVELYEAERTRMQAKAKDGKKKAAKTKEKEKEKEKEVEAEAGKEDHVIEMSEDGFDASSAAAASSPPEKVASSAKEEGTKAAAEPGNVEVAETTETETTEKAAPKEDNSEDDEADASVPPAGNGGTVDGKYVWTQTLQEVTVNVPLHQPTRGRDLDVVMSKKHLKVGLKADVAAGGGYIVDAPLTKPIICDDSFWTVEDGTRLVINLQKLNQMEWWDGVCDGDATIDITKIQPENSKLDDLDGETRQTVEKMMFDQRQKAMGLPSSDEQKKLDVLEKFKKQHPEMDFSNAKIS